MRKQKTEFLFKNLFNTYILEHVLSQPSTLLPGYRIGAMVKLTGIPVPTRSGPSPRTQTPHCYSAKEQVRGLSLIHEHKPVDNA